MPLSIMKLGISLPRQRSHGNSSLRFARICLCPRVPARLSHKTFWPSCLAVYLAPLPASFQAD
ncbi:hypothetical protein CT0861_01196 [Colletotrichum tofieldiae]|uniref:Uncharacterized protein n=1 Tax=Colletotrichum tofieldiae TaxID=708197 RepID=A0A166U6S0_9PEZI|nr:hypothetical protein CT0861_01196 [Colletotrichum tofieldiae]